MAQYDPQRSRSRHRSGEDEGPAPVDALLGPTDPPSSSRAGDPPPEPDPDLIDLTDHADAADTPARAARNGAGASRWSDAEAAVRSDGAAAARPLVLVVAVVAAVALAWAWVRRRRRRRGAGSQD